MQYLIDANCFIEPKNRYYGFDICPGFWDWLDQQNKNGVIFSTDRIKAELAAGSDDLAKWAKQKNLEFFLPTDIATTNGVMTIANWLNIHPTFQSRAIIRFLSGADPFLIGYGMAHGHTIVSHEVHDPNQKNAVKIPTVCLQFHVPCITLFDLIRATGSKFIL